MADLGDTVTLRTYTRDSAGILGAVTSVTFTVTLPDGTAGTPPAVQTGGVGEYWVNYTPTVAATLYVLSIVPTNGAYSINPDDTWQDDVQAVSTATAGPYLTTRANFKSAFWRSDLFDYKPLLNEKNGSVRMAAMQALGAVAERAQRGKATPYKPVDEAGE